MVPGQLKHWRHPIYDETLRIARGLLARRGYSRCSEPTLESQLLLFARKADEEGPSIYPNAMYNALAGRLGSVTLPKRGEGILRL